MFQLFFNGAKPLILAIWPYSLNYTSNIIFFFFNVFVDHENIGKEQKSRFYHVRFKSYRYVKYV